MDKKKVDNKDCTTCESQNIYLLVAVIVGFAIGYLYFNWAVVVPDNGLNVTGVDEFKPDLAEATNIKEMMELYVLANTGTPATLNVKGVNEAGKYLKVVLFDASGQEIPIYVSEDYSEILSTNKINVDEFKAELQTYLDALYADAGTGELDQTEKPVVELYVMSNCPAGNAAENNIIETIKLLEDKIEFEPMYILTNYGNGVYGSLHGTYELNQDVREKIIYNMYGTSAWLDYVVAVNSQCDSTSMETCWETVATEQELDVEVIKTTYETDFDSIVTAEAAATSSNGISASPTIVVNGQKSSGTKTGESYKSLICNAFLETPDECDETVSGNTAVTDSCE